MNEVSLYTITLNPAIDRLLYLNEKLERRKSNRITEVSYDIGGKGTHASYVMSKLGVKNLALGFAGSRNIDKFKQILSEKNMEHDFTIIDGRTTRECYIMIEPEQVSAGSIMLTEKGFHVEEADIKRLFERIKARVKAEDMVLIAGSLPTNFTIDNLRQLLRILKEIGCFIACDLSGEAIKLAVKMKVDFIKPNEFELKQLKASHESLFDTVKRLNQDIDYVVTSLGEKGSYYGYDRKIYRVIPPKVKEVNDTGAGDCFVGAFLAGLANQLSIEEIVKLASGCAASKVMNKDSSTFDVKTAMELKQQVKITQL